MIFGSKVFKAERRAHAETLGWEQVWIFEEKQRIQCVQGVIRVEVRVIAEEGQMHRPRQEIWLLR